MELLQYQTGDNVADSCLKSIKYTSGNNTNNS